MSFTPTHRVPAGGLRAWATPDASQEVVTTLAPGVELQVLDTQDDWAQVEAANGWTGWVEAGGLVSVDAPIADDAAMAPVAFSEGRRAMDYEAILSSPWRRLGGELLDGLLFVVTLGIGYLIWMAFFTWRRGQTPAKSILGMRVLRLSTGTGATWGWMLLRDIAVQTLLIGFLSNITFGIAGIVAALMVFTATRQTLWDRIVGTVVIDDHDGRYVPISYAST